MTKISSYSYHDNF